MTNLLPLEKIFIKKAKEEQSQFPRPTIDYGQRYLALINHLRAEIYNSIDTGLATNSDIPGFYTAHNAEHFDEVVHYAGFLLGVETGDEVIQIKPYELYVLLVAIRIHDVGNIYGRQDHEKKCFSILKSCGSLAGDDDTEKKVIANIAQAHGGRTVDDKKDTISILSDQEPLGKFVIRSRLLASIVRFADEICESRGRAANHLLRYEKLPLHSLIFHKYASSISACVVNPKDRRLTINFSVNVKDIGKTWGCALSEEKELIEKHLIDEILDRLEKMDRERRYCNRFSRDIYTIDSIRAKVDVTETIDEGRDSEHIHLIETIAVPELCDVGYPDENHGHLKAALKDYCGPSYYERLSNHQGGGQQ